MQPERMSDVEDRNALATERLRIQTPEVPLGITETTTEGVEPQRLVADNDGFALKSAVTERQATEIPAMRYVLAIGIVLVVVAFVVVWLVMR